MFINQKVAKSTTLIFSAIFLVGVYFAFNQRTLAEKLLYTGKENHAITLDAATKMTARFQKTAKNEEIAAGYFGRDIFEKILSQNNCVGIRIYNALQDNGSPTFVLIGVGSDGKDIAGGVVGEDTFPCPPFCGSSPLYSAGAAVASK